jgi:hypothetical protein
LLPAVEEWRFGPLCRLLWEFEGRTSLWRDVTAALLLSLAWLLPFAGFVLGAIVADDLSAVTLALGAIPAVGGTLVSDWMRRNRPWRRFLANRVKTYTDPNAEAMVPVLISATDADQLRRDLRRMKLNPSAGRHLGTPPIDAPELDLYLDVTEPARWRETTSDEDLVKRIAKAIGGLGIAARVGGVEVNRG